MAKHPSAVVDGEYFGSLEDFYAAIRKLHPGVKEPSLNGSAVYEIFETMGGSPMRITITINPGWALVGGDPYYDVYIFGSSGNGDCRPFIDRIVEETRLNVVPLGESTIIGKENTGSHNLEEVITTQICQIMREQRL